MDKWGFLKGNRQLHKIRIACFLRSQLTKVFSKKIKTEAFRAVRGFYKTAIADRLKPTANLTIAGLVIAKRGRIMCQHNGTPQFSANHSLRATGTSFVNFLFFFFFVLLESEFVENTLQ